MDSNFNKKINTISFFVFVVLVKLYHVLQWSLHNGVIRRWF